MIALHPERVAGDPQSVRWVMPAGTLPVGRVRRAPGRIGEMLTDGTLSDMLVEHTAVWTWLRPELSWTAVGAEVQTALREALTHAGDWIVDPAAGEVLHRVIVDSLDGSVGDFIRSHGGSVTAERCGENVVVTLGGACEHCPAAGYTLRLRLMGELERRCPNLVEVDRGGRNLVLGLSG